MNKGKMRVAGKGAFAPQHRTSRRVQQSPRAAQGTKQNAQDACRLRVSNKGENTADAPCPAKGVGSTGTRQMRVQQNGACPHRNTDA
eukprot:gene13003-5345_t